MDAYISEEYKKDLVTCDEPPETLGTCDEPPETLVTCDEPPETLVTCDEPPETLVTCDQPPETLVTGDEPPDTLVTCDEPPKELVTHEEPLVNRYEPPGEQRRKLIRICQTMKLNDAFLDKCIKVCFYIRHTSLMRLSRKRAFTLACPQDYEQEESWDTTNLQTNSHGSKQIYKQFDIPKCEPSACVCIKDMAKVLFVILVPDDPADKKSKGSELTETFGAEDDNKNITSTGKCKISEELKAPTEEHRSVLSGWNFGDVVNERDTNNLESIPAEKSSRDKVEKEFSVKPVKVVKTETDEIKKSVPKSNSVGLESNKETDTTKAENARKKSNVGLLDTDVPDGRTRKNSLTALFNTNTDKTSQGIDDNVKNKRKNSTVGTEDEEKHKLVSFLSDGENVLEKVKNTLKDMKVSGVYWSTTADLMKIGMFITDDGETCEELLKRLAALKISINVFPASISIASLQQKEEAENLKQILEKEDKLAEKVSEFKKSIKSRLVVAQVVDAVKSDAIFTFDFLMLVMLASMVAVMGLLEASSVALVASMLISPLMGPIIAGVFGTVIRNKDLLMVGFKSEMKGLCLCILIGFSAGFIPALLESAGSNWRSTESWPTIEMSARGSGRSLLIGVLIAIPSGAGVALSILGGKVGSLVGVAISASLLPPAVNAGLLWSNAIVVAIWPPATVNAISDYNSINSTKNQTGGNGPLHCPFLVNNDFIPEYSCDMAKESATLGVISLLLTVLNIFCIIIMGIVVLKIKEVAPIKSVPSAEHDFFAEDIKIARESYQTAKGQDSLLLGKRFLQEYKTVKNDLGVDDSDDDECELHKIVEEVEESADVKEIIDQMPHKPKRWSRKNHQNGSAYLNDDHNHVDRVYKTIQIGSFSPFNMDEGIKMRKRHASGEDGTASLDISLPENSYYTIHRLPSPRAVSGKFHFSKTGRFKVNKVTEKSPVKSEKVLVNPKQRYHSVIDGQNKCPSYSQLLIEHLQQWRV
ncbi:hypothetical protein Btru_066903 [Bulinus truncatus]|nr:hypothetical protein Btru_066903 [Bulinus truncatus]